MKANRYIVFKPFLLTKIFQIEIVAFNFYYPYHRRWLKKASVLNDKLLLYKKSRSWTQWADI